MMILMWNVVLLYYSDHLHNLLIADVTPLHCSASELVSLIEREGFLECCSDALLVLRR